MSDEVVVKKKRVQILTPEQKARKNAAARARYAALTTEQKLVRNGRTPEQLASMASYQRARYASLTPEQKAGRSSWMKAWAARRSPEQKARCDSLTPEQLARKSAVRKASYAAATPEQKVRRVGKVRARFASFSSEKLSALADARRLSVARRYEKVSASSQNCRARRENAEGVYTHHDIKALLASQRGSCPNCQTPLITRGPGKYHVDHVIPLSMGGSNWPSNLQLMCPPCNLSKGAKHPDVWMADNPRKRAVDFIPF